MKETDFDSILEQNSSLIDQIGDKAGNIHNNVNQKYGSLSYHYHLDMVAELVRAYGYLICKQQEDVIPIIFAAYFHDSIEDARLSYNDVRRIAEEYMDKAQAYMAAEIVYALTNEKGRNRAERENERYFEGIRKTPYAPFVKLCDRYANYSFSKEEGSRMAKMYEKEMPSFLEGIGATNAELIPSELIERFDLSTFLPHIKHEEKSKQAE